MYLARFVLATCLPLWWCATGELLCTSATSHGRGLITQGTYVTLNCSWASVDEDVDNSNLNWYRIDSGEEMSPISAQNGEAIWRMAGLDNGVEFLCVGQNSTSGDVSTCTLMPLVVPPTVSVENLGGAFVLGKEASLICKAEGLPSIDRYHWYVDGLEDEGLGSRLRRSEDGKIVTIERLMISDDGSVITCEAYIPSGLKASANLTIDLDEPSVDEGGSVSSLWIFIACAAAGGIPVIVLIVVCLAWCLHKARSRARRKRSKKRSQSRRHIVLNEEQNEVHESPIAETTLNERQENGLTSNSSRAAANDDEDDGTNPPPHKPAPPPPLDLHLDPDSTYVNTPAPTSAATLPMLGHRPTSPPYYSTPRSSHQRKKTEYENVASPNEDDNGHPNDHTEPRADVYENVAPSLPSRPLSPKPTLGHTASLPDFLT
ncbi:uncharacterized protein LOC119722759 [Patiria miniata]|uniref:Ig-like domain-containing protein n=1 Tax=Patiria miniata TaxID=46514 RepID=A0A913ZDG4_PATMI|nr:uncharacterized protein LOC119722759 [Patiria miniata]